MADNARLRWIVLLSALGLTVGAIFYPVEDPVIPNRLAAASSPAAKTAMENMRAPAPSAADNEVPGTDPFAPRGWVAPPPPPPAPIAAAVTSTVAPVDLTPSGPPELPFRFIGGFNDGGEQTIYLARGEQSYVARVGEVIETNYKVLGVTQTHIEFEHLPTGIKQMLAFPARDN